MKTPDTDKPAKAGAFKRFLYWNYMRLDALQERWSARVTARGWFVLGALMMAALFGVDTTRSSAYQAFAFLFSLVVVAALFTPLLRGKFEISRELPRFASAGKPMPYRVRLRNLSGKAFRELRIRERSAEHWPRLETFAFVPEPREKTRNLFDRTFIYHRWRWHLKRSALFEEKNSAPCALPAKGTVEFDASLTPNRRGMIELKGVRIVRLDPFGLFQGDAWAQPMRNSAHSIIVLPKRYTLPALNLPGKLQYQTGLSNVTSGRGQSEEFVSLREYRDGDPLRHIHWPAWARTGRPIVKEFEEEFFPRYALVLDTFVSPHQEPVFEEAVALAASFAYSLNTDESLLDLLFVGTRAFAFTAGKGTSSVEKMLEVLATLEPASREDFPLLEQMVTERAPEISACILVLCGWDAKRERLLNTIRKLRLPILPVVIGESAEPPAGARGQVAWIDHANVPAGLGQLPDAVQG